MILRFLHGSPAIASASPALSLSGSGNAEALRSNMDDLFKNAALSKEEEELFNQLQERETESPRDQPDVQRDGDDADASYKEFVDGLSNGASGSSSSHLKDKNDESSASDSRTPDRPTRLSDVHLEERQDLSVTFVLAPDNYPAQEIQVHLMGVTNKQQ